MVVILLLAVAVIGGGVYVTALLMPKRDPDVLDAEPVQKPRRGKKTGNELATIVPDRIESEVVVTTPKHVIVRTWIRHSYGRDEYKWKCACGVSGNMIFQDLARDVAARHVYDGNKAEELKTKTDGRFSW